ncbi:MAG: GH3 auxin-responsive promoter family protein [Bacteroidales bacterium]|nr:GH3 auxin-responsive promoter family protein [Bacteroidales bacterium]MDD4670952.1 GH3 auxin-responsive promoter family protein [Bacteroidales bacterium]
MNIINNIFLLYASAMLKSTDFGRHYPADSQQKTFRQLIKGGADTLFGHEHDFGGINSIEDFQRRVPIREYDAMQPYIEKLRTGENYILWNEKTSFFAKSSGTSSDKSKYIPVTPTNLRGCHYGGMQRMLANYVHHYPDSRIFNGKALTLGGSVEPDLSKNTFSGDLSAILLKNSPSIVEIVRVPDRNTAMLYDFNEKVEKICEKCSRADVTNFAGVPSWNLILLRRIIEYNKAKYLTEVWPNIELFMHGGISFEPYIKQFDEIISSTGMRYFENYNASEGYFAFQDDPQDKSMLLTLDNGVFYEFIPLRGLDETLASRQPVRALCIEDVKVNEPYAIVISTTAGLWRYLIGDVVTFTSTFPHKIVISGRTKLFINAFGEELMIGNAEDSLTKACKKHNVTVTDYTVAPIFMSKEGKGGHQWAIEFNTPPEDLEAFADTLDKEICECNSDYEAKRTHTITMDRLVISAVPHGTFYKWMNGRGKTGGQNKVPRLSGSRTYIEQILSM